MTTIWNLPVEETAREERAVDYAGSVSYTARQRAVLADIDRIERSMAALHGAEWRAVDSACDTSHALDCTVLARRLAR